ncbi:MAG: LLM class flavin-dependent oxidoreductase [Acidobacteria bacterium]|nr:MAG: LLM class flavin-dependent oxidoreductase [Acidobacteriota bacterium]REJ99396.1 MAG: LLM class flavin-dependent oxidoreductase [Acidobacteriota bacterium]
MRFGLTPWRFPAHGPGIDDAGSADLLIDQARRAEELGFDSFWLPESHFVEAARPAPLLELAAVAGATRRLRLGTTSLIVPVRHPVLLAEEIAVLDRLSRGRLIVGLGRGFRPALFEVFGVDPRRKRDLFEDAVLCMRRAWGGAVLCSAGDRVGSDDPGAPAAPRLSPLPMQQPHPPLWVAAFGPKALAQAGRLGLPYLCSPLETFEEVEANWRLVRQAAAGAAGGASTEAERRDGVGEAAVPDRRVPVMRTVFVSTRPERVEAARRALAAESVGWRRSRSLAGRSDGGERPSVPGGSDDPSFLVGVPDEVADAIRLRRDRLGITDWIVRSPSGLLAEEWLEESIGLLGEMAGEMAGGMDGGTGGGRDGRTADGGDR